MRQTPQNGSNAGMKEKEERERTSAWKESLSMGDKGSLVALQVAALKMTRRNTTGRVAVFFNWQ